MRLRWVKGKWKEGKFRLQYERLSGDKGRWEDVPVVEEEKPCPTCGAKPKRPGEERPRAKPSSSGL